jgi:hypothetical protein
MGNFKFEDKNAEITAGDILNNILSANFTPLGPMETFSHHNIVIQYAGYYYGNVTGGPQTIACDNCVNGLCTSNNTCTCYEGFTGSSCEERKCLSVTILISIFLRY